MKFSVQNFWFYLHKYAFDLGFIFLLIFTVVTLTQVEIVRVVRTFGVAKQEIRLDKISSTAQPLNLSGIPNEGRAYVHVSLEFRIDGATGYPNLFQTDVLNSGIRAELNGRTIALLFPSPNEKNNTKALVLSDKLNIGQWYSFNLEALNGSFITSGLSGSKVSYSGYGNPEFETSSIRVGIGYDDIRRFRGEIRNVVITTSDARMPWVGTLVLYTIKILLLVLVVFFLNVGYKNTNFIRGKLSRAALFHFIFQIPSIAYVICNDSSALSWLRDLWTPFYTAIPWAWLWSTPTLNSIAKNALLLVIVGSLALVPVAYRRPGRIPAFAGQVPSLTLAAYEVICSALLTVTNNLAGLFLWLTVVGLLPAYIFFNQRRLSKLMAERVVLAACLFLLVGVVGSLVSTSWNPSLRFLNDYADLPEYTVLENGRQVENRAYLRDHGIQGEYFHDPCESAADGSCLHLSRHIFANERIAFNTFPPGRGLVYDWDKEILRAYRPLTREDAKIISRLWGIALTEVQLGRRISNHTSNSSPEVNDFLFKNRMELSAQASLGRFIYHHAFLYLPALEAAMSLPTSVTPAQYGNGLTHTLGVLLRMGGTPNFQTYYKIYWISIVAYLILLGAIAWWITRNKWIGIVASATGIAFTLSVEPDALRMAPGFNPMRHLPDLFCLMIIAIDSRRNSCGSALLRATAIAFFLWWNKEFGIFLLFGSIVWHFFQIVGGYRRWRAGLGRIAIEFILATLILAISGVGESNGLVLYNLMGIGTPPTRWRDAIYWLMIWIPAIGMVAWWRFFSPSGLPRETSIDSSLLDVSGVGLIYAGFTTIYALWNPSPNHYAVVALSAVLPFATMFVWGHLRLSARDVRFSWLSKYVAASATVMALVFAYHAKLEFLEYDQVFKDHRIFEWRFAGLRGLTTADPKMLDESAELVQKYQPEGRILFVSRYDTLMQTILNRPGVLPYIDIPSSIVSWRMIDRVAAKIKESKPAYIFADRDLQIDKEWAITDFFPDPSVISPSSHRVGSLAALAQVIRVIAPCYMPGEVRGVLQVWHRTCA